MPSIGKAVGAGLSLLGSRKKSGGGGGGRAQAAISKEQLDLYKEIYADYKKYLKPLEIEQVQAERDLVPFRQRAIEDYINSGIENREFYETVYRPIEEEFARQAREGIADRTQFLTSRAANEVDKQFDNQRDRTRRNYERQGLDDPGSGQFRGLNRGYDVAQAAARANQINNTRVNEERRVEDVNFSRLGDGVRAGNGLRRPNQPGIFPQGNFSSTPGTAAGVLSGAATSASGAANANYRQNEANARDTAGALYGLGRTFGNDGGIFSSGGISSGGGGSYYGTRAGGVSLDAAEAGGLFNFAGGGEINVPSYAQGGEINSVQEPAYGLVRGPGTGTSDSVPVSITNHQGRRFDGNLSDGEYVIPERVVRVKGVEFFDKLVEKIFNKESVNDNAGLNRNMTPNMRGS